MKVEMEQQQQQVHDCILNGIARLSDPQHRDKRHKMFVRQVVLTGNAWTGAVYNIWLTLWTIVTLVK
jgi:chitodextrinase